ncbi:hypothetical protein [Streptomyces sp. WAC00263]|uniref:hypothetical protein n=1 Tax=Streptomyces sp. WAC00263 TaxID=1917422 RepID=UPI0019D61C08|nr:hypothetical protein [Streptomyces sp. WAC00263]
METRWEAKLAALAEAEQALDGVRKARPSLPEPDALKALATDLPRLWHAPDTHHKDRKRLLRTLIADVTLLPEPNRNRARIGVRWHTGATDEISVMRNDLRTPTAAIDLITRLGPTHTDDELVAQLNAAGLTTGKKRPFDVKAVRWARHAYRIRAPRTVPYRHGEIGIDDMARILGVSYSAAYYWITHYRLDARQDRSGRWCVTWNETVEADCRARVASSGHLNPTGPGARPLPEEVHGCLTVHDVAMRLGVPADAVYYWIRIHRLHARRTTSGRWSIPWNDEIEASARQSAARTQKYTPTTQTTTAGGAV